MRATKAPPQDKALAATPDAQAGSNLFNQIGLRYLPRSFDKNGTARNRDQRGAIHGTACSGQQSDSSSKRFLLHDVGPGDGIVQNGGAQTRNKLRTAPLWGLRTRGRLMHDGESLTRDEAIRRHAGEASVVINKFRSLTLSQKKSAGSLPQFSLKANCGATSTLPANRPRQS